MAGLWAFLLFDLGFFALLMTVFVVEKAQQLTLFTQGAQSLDSRLGALNTLILLTSSWLMTGALHAARLAHWRAVRRWMQGVALCGAAFAAIKGIEYTQAFADGVSPLSDLFHQLYFVTTFLHLLHVAAGVAALCVFARWLRRSGLTAASPRITGWIESVGIYWHMVDLLWIAIFTLLYLGGRP